jgi:hypothetical protein
MNYRKKNAKILVEAQMLTEDNGWDLESWCGGKFTCFSGIAFLELTTDAGKVRAFPNSYIIKDAVGKFSTMDKDTFEAEYEPAP